MSFCLKKCTFNSLDWEPRKWVQNNDVLSTLQIENFVEEILFLKSNINNLFKRLWVEMLQ